MPAYVTMLVPFAVVALLGLMLWWAFGPGTDRALRKDYGLLREVAKVPSTRAAGVVEGRLHDAGISATTVPSADGESLRILVFPDDEATAVRVLLTSD